MADANKTASVKLDLKADGFKRGLKNAEGDAAKSGAHMGASLSSGMTRGAKAGLDAVKSMFGKLKSGFALIGGPLAGIGLGVLVKDAMQASTAFRQLAFQISTATGKTANIDKLKATLHGMAKESGVAVEDLIHGFGSLAKVGGPEFAEAALRGVLKTSKATGLSLETLTEITGGLHEQFGLTGKEATGALALINKSVSSSDLTIDEYASKFELVAAAARQAGITGAEGVKMTIGMLDRAKFAFGGLRKGGAALIATLDMLSNAQERTKVYGKLGIGVEAAAKDSPVEAMRKIVAATKGSAASMAKAQIAAPQVKILSELGKGYSEAYAQTTGDVKAKTAAGIAAIEKSLKDVGDAEQEAARIEKEYQASLRSAATQSARALEVLKEAFDKPEIVAAINKLAAMLPGFAEGLAGTVPMILGNLKLLVPVGIAAKFGMGAFSNALSGQGAAMTASFGSAGKSADGLGTALGRAGGATLAFSAATFGVSMAVDQISKLLQDLADQDKDVADERENALHAAELQGDTYAKVEKKKSGWDVAKFIATGGSSAMFDKPEYEYVSRGKGGKGVQVLKDEPVSVSMKGETYGTFPTAVQNAIQHGTVQDNLRKQQEAAAAAYQAKAFPQNVAPGTDPHKDALAVAHAIAGRELKVRITNPQDVGKVGGGAGGPTPGPVERP